MYHLKLPTRKQQLATRKTKFLNFQLIKQLETRNFVSINFQLVKRNPQIAKSN